LLEPVAKVRVSFLILILIIIFLSYSIRPS
jgi:hypothetical protein